MCNFIWTFGELIGQIAGISKDYLVDFGLGGEGINQRGRYGWLSVKVQSTQFHSISNKHTDQSVSNVLSSLRLTLPEESSKQSRQP